MEAGRAVTGQVLKWMSPGLLQWKGETILGKK